MPLTASAVKERALALGFDLTGIAPAEAFAELDRLGEWLSRGYGGEMTYLQRSQDTRADIRNFLSSARTVIVTGTVYYTEVAADRPATIARYALGEDYHRVLEDRLEQLVSWMREQSPDPFDARIFVDKHHVQERVFAKHAGLGWIGKNTCLINPALGSWMFLAGVAISLTLETDAAGPDRCGACSLCIDACPTGALVDDYELDARRCISYLTIEHSGPIPEAARAMMGEHVFGCDICQEVCPFNLAPLSTLNPAWQPDTARAAARPAELWRMSDFELHRLVEGSAMTRAPMSRLRRNLAVALGNSGEAHAVDTLGAPGGGIRRAAQSAETPLVQEHVAWARSRLAGSHEGHDGHEGSKGYRRVGKSNTDPSCPS